MKSYVLIIPSVQPQINKIEGKSGNISLWVFTVFLLFPWKDISFLIGKKAPVGKAEKDSCFSNFTLSGKLLFLLLILSLFFFISFNWVTVETLSCFIVSWTLWFSFISTSSKHLNNSKCVSILSDNKVKEHRRRTLKSKLFLLHFFNNSVCAVMHFSKAISALLLIPDWVSVLLPLQSGSNDGCEDKGIGKGKWAEEEEEEKEEEEKEEEEKEEEEKEEEEEGGREGETEWEGEGEEEG